MTTWKEGAVLDEEAGSSEGAGQGGGGRHQSIVSESATISASASASASTTAGVEMENGDKGPRRSASGNTTDRQTSSKDITSPGQEAPTMPAKMWTTTQKWVNVSTASLVCFVVGINATAILTAAEEISDQFDLDLERFDYSFFLVTAWNTGAAIAPLFVLPLMEDLGIRTIYYSVYLIFVVFVVVQAVASNFATLIVSRVIAGSCGGVLQNCVDALATDVWGEDIHSRALSLTLFIFCLLGGVTIGPVIGGGVIKSLSWRWIVYVELIIYGAIVPYVWLTLRETRTRLPLDRKGTRKERFKAALNETILRAIRLLFTEFVVGSFTLLSSFAFGTVLILTQSIPQVYSTLYNWPAWKTGVVQISLFIGETLGAVLCVVQDKVVYPRFAYRKYQSEVTPEPRLYMTVPCSILGLTAGFFIYGWTASESLSWVLPSLGLLLIGVGIMVIIQAVSTYVTDCYVAHASSAISGVAFGENIFAAFLPLATRDMYNRLGFQWASSLLGFLGLFLSMAPVILILSGEKIRAKSKYVG